MPRFVYQSSVFVKALAVMVHDRALHSGWRFSDSWGEEGILLN
jgi:hypothetical protein